jgi:dTDP-4-dehydrorhamnose reductase
LIEAETLMSGRPLWITGARGLIGNWLLRIAPARKLGGPVVGLTHDQLELTDFAAVRVEFRRQNPQLVIHCAALSRSPECQSNPELARKINVEATALLAELSADIPFFFFSSDLVFDGRSGNYDESATVNPLSVYAETKVAAERLILANPTHTVIRTSLNCGASISGSRGFDEQLRCAWKTGQTLRLFTDEFRSPIPAEATARAVWELAGQASPGIYHVAGSERLSRWQIGRLVAERWPELTPRIEAGSLKEYTGAPRPADTSLNCAKAQRLLSFQLPGLSEWLAVRDDGM